jgi:hypothetical protein
MSTSQRHWVYRLVSLPMSVIFAWLLVEAASWGYLRFHPPHGPIGRWAFRASCPLPYRNADYYGADFLDESMRCVRPIALHDKRYLVPGDFNGRFFNVRDGLRRTTDQPASSDHRVLLFGGSTMFCQEVPDSHTLASCLQRCLDQQPGLPRYRVENLGMVCMIARQQTERLEQTPLQPGDVVLFYDGVNDVLFPIYNGNLEGFRVGDHDDGGVRTLTGPQKWLYPLSLRLKKYSYAASLLFCSMDGPRPANMVDRAALSRHLDVAERNYRDALTHARRLAELSGARFVHVLQPNVFTLYNPSDYEREVMRNELKLLPGLDQAFLLGYPRLRRALSTVTDLVSYDLADALDSRDQGEEFYLDSHHVNHSGNERLARIICERVFTAGSAE